MSIIRDLLEYYRQPAEVKTHQDAFDVDHKMVHGYDVRYYYNKGTITPTGYYVKIIDNFTFDNVQYNRIFEYYDDDFNLINRIEENEYGTRRRTETYTYGGDGQLLNIENVMTIISVTWAPNPPSTGWPTYGPTGGGIKWTRIDHSTQAEAFHGYLCYMPTGAYTLTLPSAPEEGDVVAVEDTEGLFNIRNLHIARNGKYIMGLAENLVLNEKNQGVQLVYDGINDWRIVWATPLVANVTV